MSSRITRKPVILPPSLSLNIRAGLIELKSGTKIINVPLHSSVIPYLSKNNELSFEENKSLENQSKSAYSQYAGTVHRSVCSAIKDITSPDGFVIDIYLKGVGYKATVLGDVVTFILGYSHSIKVLIPSGIKITVDKFVNIRVSGVNRVAVGDFVKYIQSLRKNNVYNGAGIYRLGSVPRRKDGKKSKK